MRECSNSRHFIQISLLMVYEDVCSAKMYLRMKRTYWNHQQLHEQYSRIFCNLWVLLTHYMRHKLTTQKFMDNCVFTYFRTYVLASRHKSKTDGKLSQQASGKANDISQCLRDPSCADLKGVNLKRNFWIELNNITQYCVPLIKNSTKCVELNTNNKWKTAKK
jgi:hypothetical protein